MNNRVIAAVPVATNKTVLWFEGGLARLYSNEELGVDIATFHQYEIAESGSSVTWGNGVSLTAEELSAKGSAVDLVQAEKQRILKELSRIRRSSSFSQTRLGEAAGIRQSVISRIEGCEISPQINTLLKLLAPLGKTLAIVDLEEE